MSTDLQTAQEAREIAEANLATVRAQTEAVALERTRGLLESPQPVVVPWQEYPAFDDFSRWPSSADRPYVWSGVDDYSEGRYRPLYENEQDLRRMRAECRRLYHLFPVAQGAIGALTNYTIANGFEFKVKPKEAHKTNPTAIALAAALQPTVDRFIARNDFVGVLDREIETSSRVDGECFPTLYPDGRDVRIELVEPDCICEPAEREALARMLRQSHKLNHWWHGVHTQYSRELKRDDVARPLGYHAIFDRLGADWDYLFASRVQHIKRNVNSRGRRGVSDLKIVLQDLENEAKIRRNTAVGAAILAAIVMIRQHAPGTSQSSVERMVGANATSTYQRNMPNGSRTIYDQHTPPGTVKDVPAGMEHKIGPLGELRSPVYIEVAQYLQRIIGSRWNMPEYLISGDASNANYSSTLVSEGPFIKAREADQAFYAVHFEALIWKALAMYAELGAISAPWQLACELVDVKAEYASPASRNRVEQAQVNRILSDAGILSDRTWAADMLLDLDEEKANGAEKKIEPAPLAVPGQFGGRPLGSASRLEALAEGALASLIEGRAG